MMIDETLSAQLTRSIESAQNIIILLDRNASFDQAASAIALAQSLEQGDKEVRLVVPELLPGLDQLSEVSRMSTELGHQSLTISFDYSEDKVDNISYHIGEETKKFYLTVKPKAGAEPLDPESVEYSYTGATADLLILMGVHDLDDLDQLYFGYEELFRNTTSIAINIFEAEFGTIKIDVSASSTTSEFVYALLINQNLPISADAATNLLAGIEHATNRFQSRTISASTFETAAKLMNLGARRILPMSPGVVAVVPDSTPQSTSPTLNSEPQSISPRKNFSTNSPKSLSKSSSLVSKSSPKSKQRKTSKSPKTKPKKRASLSRK